MDDFKQQNVVNSHVKVQSEIKKCNSVRGITINTLFTQTRSIDIR